MKNSMAKKTMMITKTKTDKEQQKTTTGISVFSLQDRARKRQEVGLGTPDTQDKIPLMMNEETRKTRKLGILQ